MKRLGIRCAKQEELCDNCQLRSMACTSSVTKVFTTPSSSYTR
jgi:hypothetical protein